MMPSLLLLRLHRLGLALGLTLSSSLMLQSPGYGQSGPGLRAEGFWCDRSGPTPTTRYRNIQGRDEAWIRWRSEPLAVGQSPAQVCQQVSDRLEAQRQTQTLHYISATATALCLTPSPTIPCETPLFHVAPTHNPTHLLHQFWAWQEGSPVSIMPTTLPHYLDLRVLVQDPTDTAFVSPTLDSAGFAPLQSP